MVRFASTRYWLGLLVVLCLLLAAAPLLADVGPGPEPPAATADRQDQSVAGEEGIASYYASRYKGRRTNSGERYNPKKLTAAHPTLPLGTRVRVENLANGKEVVVTVNDRCRKHRQPFIDVSREAARQLGFLGKGTTRVLITPLTEDDEES